ncbi:MAG TPA: hypothetical protein HPP80_05050, partial [Rhodospirillaceae bacterium]|nr:hypothetical protein [Rhodospirillaceae bacterium]
AAMAAWNAADIWPDQLGWKSSRNEMMAAITAFAEDRLKDPALQTVLVVSSNGVLRFLPRLLLAPDDHLTSFKMGTGHLGVIERTAQACKLAAWNLAPEALSLS